MRRNTPESRRSFFMSCAQTCCCSQPRGPAPVATKATRMAALSPRPSTCFLLVLMSLCRQHTTFHFLPFTSRRRAQPQLPPDSASAGAVVTTTPLGAAESRYLWNQVFRLPQLDRALVSLQAAAVDAALKRCTLQFFALVLNTLNPRTIYGNDFIVSAIITCMATTLDRLYSRVGSGSSSGDSSSDSDMLLVSDCVRLLHGDHAALPDYVGLIAGLPGGTSYDHFVSLVRLQFESPVAAITAADDDPESKDHEKSDQAPGGQGVDQRLDRLTV